MLKKYINFLKSAKNGAIVFFGTIFFIATILFLFDLYFPIYKIPAQNKFSGNGYYNPYKNYDNATYYRSNFHLMLPEALKTYNELEYGYALTTLPYRTNNNEYYNFPKLYGYLYFGTFLKPTFILFGFEKSSVQGNKKYGGTSMKVWSKSFNGVQFKMNSQKPLKKAANNMIALAYPAYIESINIDLMPKLTGYNLIEILYGDVKSLYHWDTALSNGRPAFLLASDKLIDDFKDNSTNFHNFAKSITMIPISPAADNISNVYQALKTGASYAYNLSNNITSLPIKDKLNALKNLPYLTSMQVNNDELTVKFNKNIDKIVFSADFGKVVKEEENVSKASYNITDNESYVRVTAYFDNGSVMYFNPVIKSEDSIQPEMPALHIDYKLSIIKWFLPGLLALHIIITYMYIIISAVIKDKIRRMESYNKKYYR